jgi:hypothetical protein
MDFSPLRIWAVVRLLPKMQRVVINRFRRRSDAENYLHLLRQQIYDANLTIVFDPPSRETNLEAHSKSCEKSTLSSSSMMSPKD